MVDDEDAPTDLDLLIDAIVDANDDAGYAPPRPVWPEPLGERVELDAPPSADRSPRRSGVRSVGGRATVGVVRVALADDPDRQRQIPAGWDLVRRQPAADGDPRQRHEHDAGQPSR